MRMMRWIGGLGATAVAAGGLLVGTGTAFADDGTSPAPAPHAQSALCTTRIPNVLDRIDTLVTRIGADAGTRGSTAWMQAKAQQARGAGYTATADLLEARADGRSQRLDQLATLKSDVEHVRATDCAA